MKQCPECKRTYGDETLNFCLEDGSRLRWVGEDAPTQRFPSSDEMSSEDRVEARHQDIQFCTTADGVGIAYSVIGSGLLLVRVLGHFTHLEKEWEWPDLRHFWERLAERFTVVRYDGRGIGLSDSYAGEFTEEARQSDLDAVMTDIGERTRSCSGYRRADGRRQFTPTTIPSVSDASCFTARIAAGQRRGPATTRRKTKLL